MSTSSSIKDISIAQIRSDGARLFVKDHTNSTWKFVEKSHSDAPASQTNSQLWNVSDLIFAPQTIQFSQYGAFYHDEKSKREGSYAQVELHLGDTHDLRLSEEGTMVTFFWKGSLTPASITYNNGLKTSVHDSKANTDPTSYPIIKLTNGLQTSVHDPKTNIDPTSYPIAKLFSKDTNSAQYNFKLVFEKTSYFSWPACIHLLAVNGPWIAKLNSDLMNLLRTISLDNFIALNDTMAMAVKFRPAPGGEEGSWFLPGEVQNATSSHDTALKGSLSTSIPKSKVDITYPAAEKKAKQYSIEDIKKVKKHYELMKSQGLYGEAFEVDEDSIAASLSTLVVDSVTDPITEGFKGGNDQRPFMNAAEDFESDTFEDSRFLFLYAKIKKLDAGGILTTSMAQECLRVLKVCENHDRRNYSFIRKFIKESEGMTRDLVM